MPHALIVDDSRTARAVLKHMLSKESYDVEAAESAEQGLNYLRDGSTDVIFMDHMMPGMDGFQAVKQLKANDDLKHIPIVMYTSKEGDVYRGQANALGATSILSKPATQAQLQQVLKEVAASVVSASRADTRAEHKEATANKANGLANDEKSAEKSSDEISKPVAASEPTISLEVGNDQASGTVDTVDAITSAAQAASEPDKSSEDSGPNPVAQMETVSEKPSRMYSWLMPMLLIFGILAALIAGAQYSELRRAHDAAVKSNEELLRSVVVIANQAGRFQPGELGFSGQRVDLLRAVVEAADAAEFNGTLLLTAHAGQFCMSQSPSGELYVADDQLAIAECVAVGINENAAVRQTETLSSRFRELLEVHPVLKNQKVSVQVQGAGDSQPLKPYPDADDVNTAGDWNSVARANNRVEFQLIPE